MHGRTQRHAAAEADGQVAQQLAALPWLDAMLTALSLVGQWWQARRHVACWWIWIAVDVVYVGAYLFKSLHVTAALYVFFLGLAVFGLRAWSAAAREPQVATQ